MANSTHKYSASYTSRARIAGQCEQGFWKPLKYRWGQYFDAIDAFAAAHAADKSRYGPWALARDVFKVLVKATGSKGRLELSLSTIAKRARAGKTAVVAALKLLRDNGFVRWMNRYVVASDDGFEPGIWGPQVWQTSNAYAVELPDAAMVAKPAPPPVDDAARRADLAAQIRAMADDDDTGLNGALNALGRLIQGRAPPD